MNKKLSVIAFGAAFIGMGIAMPQCPGEKALQQQVDTLQSGQNSANQKLSALEGQVKTMSSDVTQQKQLMGELAKAVQAQKEAMDRMDSAIKELQTKGASHPGSKAKAKHKGK